MKKLLTCLTIALFTSMAGGTAAELKPAHFFQDHMVLQRQKPIPVWGKADPDATVTVSLAGKQASAKADATGAWKATLPAMEANSTGQTLTISSGGKNIELKDVLIGEVWVCAGQSNMVAWPYSGDPMENAGLKAGAADANYPLVRYINYPAAVSDTPLTDMDPVADGQTTWTILSPETSGKSMSVPFFFGRNLFKQLNVPVGLVEVAVPGTTQTAWVSKETLDGQKDALSYQACFDEAEKRLAQSKDKVKSWADFVPVYAAWHTNKTYPPPNSLNIMDYPAVLYNALIHPLAPMAIRGVLWHQGEAGPFMGYGSRLVAMANQWRQLFGQDFVFIFGTMTRNTNTPPPLDPVVESYRGNLNEEFLLAQKMFGRDSNSALCGFIDLGDWGTHWGHKDEAGRRMALAAMDRAYGKASVYTGPQMIEGTISGNTVRCKFTDVGSGLVYEPSIEGVSGFVLVGKVGGQDKMVWVTPKIEGPDMLTFSSPEIPQPTNLYYGWHPNAHETLFNKEGYAAYCFRVAASPDHNGPATRQLVTAATPLANKAVLHISEVRRSWYVLSIVTPQAGQGTSDVKALIPKDWTKPAVAQDGKDIAFGDVTTGPDGEKYITLHVQYDTAPLVIYDASKPDALKSANTNRY